MVNLGNGSIKVQYYEEIDVLVIKLRDGKASDTVKLAEDVFAIVNEKNEILEIEIWRAKDLVINAIADKIVERIKAVKRGS